MYVRHCREAGRKDAEPENPSITPLLDLKLADLITRRTSIAALTALAFAVARACHSARSAAESSLHVQGGAAVYGCNMRKS